MINYNLDETQIPEVIIPRRLTLRGYCKCDCGWEECADYEEGNQWSEDVAFSTLKLSHKKHLTLKENGKCFCDPVIERNFI